MGECAIERGGMPVSEDIYEKLREHLDGLPPGFPETPGKVELRILKKLFTEEEAEVFMRLRLLPEPPSLIAPRLGMSEERASEILRSMAGQGSIMSVRQGGKTFYASQGFLIGVYEFHVDKMDRELAEMCYEYLPYMADALINQFRVVPVHAAIDAAPAVTGYYRVRELVKQHKDISLAECICRKEKRLLDKGCEHPAESCLAFGVGARYYIDQGKGRPIGEAEALAVLERSERGGLVLMPNNSRDIASICSCCSCCCGVLRSLKLQDRPAEHVRSGFRAVIEESRCDTCAACLERCPMDAVVDEGKSMRVDAARCIGCGLCATGCGQAAISLEMRTDAPGMPANYFHMMSEMAAANGAGFGKLSPVLRLAGLELMVKSMPLLYASGLGKPVTDQLAKRGII